ncbi:MAG: secretin N-terminal domain-containing protein [Candidatus Omnitrophica bacterium]|nr:secretin N-terminal domain-containing protein [Candidatus Omnitrophota bacterium]MDD5352636.1 secretin N-terminal domain-containing protein [Candidatus Omnitrophota bacterium]MDD5550235.1 secretin N-terminal domain-containing protein [Candidatus Omnitrophota bacterium]
MFNKKANRSFLSIFIILVFSLLLVIFSFPDSTFAGLSEELLTQASWRKISLDLEGASLINVLKIFSQQSGLNFIAAQEVADKSITLYLDNVPIRDALEKILSSYNLVYELDEGSNIFVVKELQPPPPPEEEPIKTITRVYTLKYARVNSSPLNTASGTSTSGSSLADALQNLISGEGRISEDSRTNSLVITDLPSRFERIEEMIKKLDVPVPQVVIEAEIIDTTKQLVDTLGMEWSGTLYTLTLAGRTGMAFPFDTFGSVARDIAKTQITTGSISVPTDSSSATLQLLITDKNTKVLARPRIRTLSNETAEIKITGNDAVGTVVTYDQQGDAQSTSAERYEVGVTLKVTPSVNAETGEVTMVLEPTISSVEDSNLTGYFDPQERSAKVTISVLDGETVVIGGLLRKDLNDTRKKVPILGDIPFAGAMFRHKDRDDKNRELLVFITPRILKTPGIDLAKSQSPKQEPLNKEIFEQREQADYQYRKGEIDKALSIWENK